MTLRLLAKKLVMLRRFFRVTKHKARGCLPFDVSCVAHRAKREARASERSRGFILPLTIMIIFMAVTMLTTVMRRAFVFQDKVRFAFEREKARTLAMGGLQIGMAQLSVVRPKDDAKNKAQAQSGAKAEATRGAVGAQGEKDKLTPEQEWLKQIMLVINRWHKFTLTKAVDGIDGVIQIYISCEQGKINLNSLLVEKYTPVGSSAALQTPAMQQAGQEAGQAGARKDFAQSLEEKLVQELGVSILGILKPKVNKLGRNFEDPTELLTEEATKKFGEIFKAPSSSKETREKFFLMDLFTVETKSEKLNPWVLSASVCALLGFQVPAQAITEGKDKKLQEAVKKLRPFIGWKKEWDITMQPLYGKPFSAIPQGIDVIFAPEFEATIFSLIVYAQVGSAVQKLCGVVEKVVAGNSTLFRLKKIYWI